MSINTLEFKTKLTDGLDEQLVAKSATSFMLDNVMRAKFVGAKTVLIPSVDFVGLGDYDRESGFASGGVTLTHKSYTLTRDRGRTFTIDREDMDEIGISNLAGQLMGEFVRTEVAPEIDAYVLSKLAATAKAQSHTESLASGKTIENGCLKLLSKLIADVNDQAGYDEPTVAFLNPTFYNALMNSEELSRRIDIGSFEKGSINTQVKFYNGCALIPVSDSRMKTAFDFKDGITAGETDGGFAPSSDASSIGAVVLPKKACSLIKKTEKIRIFEPDQNYDLDAYKFDYRIYYDCLIPDSRKNTVFAYIY